MPVAFVGQVDLTVMDGQADFVAYNIMLVRNPGYLVGKIVRLVNERLRIRIPAGAAGNFLLQS